MIDRMIHQKRTRDKHSATEIRNPRFDPIDPIRDIDTCLMRADGSKSIALT